MPKRGRRRNNCGSKSILLARSPERLWPYSKRLNKPPRSERERVSGTPGPVGWSSPPRSQREPIKSRWRLRVRRTMQFPGTLSLAGNTAKREARRGVSKCLLCSAPVTGHLWHHAGRHVQYTGGSESDSGQELRGSGGARPSSRGSC